MQLVVKMAMLSWGEGDMADLCVCVCVHTDGQEVAMFVWIVVMLNCVDWWYMLQW